jgi:hypothetical protein
MSFCTKPYEPVERRLTATCSPVAAATVAAVAGGAIAEGFSIIVL